MRTWVETAVGKRVAPTQVAPVPHAFHVPYLFVGHHVDAQWELPNVSPWSAESPTRYRVRVELIGPDGVVGQATSQMVGFRHVEVRDQQLPDGSTRLAYGGQFGESPHDGNFVADGLVSSDLEPHPAMHEVAWVHRPIAVQAGRRAGTVRISNRQSFSGLHAFDARWTLLVDGVEVRSGRWRLPDVAPHASVAVPLPCAVPAGNGEVHLSVCFTLRRATWYAPAGHLVAWDQLTLRKAAARAKSRVAHARGNVDEVSDCAPTVGGSSSPI